VSPSKTKRPGTRSGKPRADSVGPTDGFRIAKKRGVTDLPADLADAAEAALDDLLAGPGERSVGLSIDVSVAEFSGTTEATARTAMTPGQAAALHAAKSDRAKPPGPPPVPRVPRPGGQAAVPQHAQPSEEADLVEVPRLRFAIYEHQEHLRAARDAIIAAGHLAVAGASGTSGISKIADEIVTGVDVVLVALPGGEAVIDIALAQDPRRPIVIAAVSGKPTEAIQRAVLAGADLVAPRPHDPESMAPMLLAAARLHTERRAAQNARGAETLLRAKLEEISDPEIRGLQPIETFQRVLELEFKRARRFEYPLSVALFAVEIPPPPPPPGIRGILRARAGNALIHTIRDIDLATQLDHERFLVLLPYTELAGAAGLGRRVIAAVAQGEPVVSAGRSFPPRLVGAVAGARAGQELSFSKLMKEATQALAQARRDGAELAVQPM
jgi:two-component system cell cycle response regulator